MRVGTACRMGRVNAGTISTAAHVPVRPPAAAAPTPAPAEREQPQPERSTFTIAATATALIGNKARSIVVDRPRVAAAFPLARREGRLGRWAVELLAGKPTSEIVPISGGTVRIAGRTLTTNGWGHAYRASNGLGTAVLAASMIYGVPNLVEALRAGGPDELTETRVGRTGMLATAGNVISLAVLGAAFTRTPSGSGRLLRMLHHPMHASTPMVVLRSATMVPVAINELGYLDFLNRGNDSSIWQNAVDTTRRWTHVALDALPGRD